MKEFKDLIIMIYLVLREQRLHVKYLKHQSKMVNFYRKHGVHEYYHKETKSFYRQLSDRICDIRNEYTSKL